MGIIQSDTCRYSLILVESDGQSYSVSVELERPFDTQPKIINLGPEIRQAYKNGKSLVGQIGHWLWEELHFPKETYD